METGTAAVGEKRSAPVGKKREGGALEKDRYKKENTGGD